VSVDQRPRSGATAPGRPRTHAESGGGWGSWLVALVACALTVVALGVVLLHPYVTNHFRYPLGWDSMLYVWRARAIPVDGIARVGAVRAGFPLLTASLGPVTGQNAFTLVAILPPILAGVAGLAAAAMVRATFRVSAWWVPVIGVVTWTAFGTNEIPLHHFDNLLNAAAVLAGFAAALAFTSRGQGLIAAAILFMAAGLAHWPFFLVAMAIFVAGVAVAAWWEGGAIRLGALGHGEPLRLLSTAAGSTAFVGITLLALPATGWLGARPGALSGLLKERIVARLDDPQRFLAVPLAVAGAYAVGRHPLPDTHPGARRLFLSLAGVWAATTLLAVVAQILGAPTAGARVLSFFFPLTILAGVLLWWVWEWAAGAAGMRVAAAALTGVVVVGSVSLFWSSWSTRHPWVEADAVQQAAAAGRYVATSAPGRDVVYLIDTKSRSDLTTIGRWWLVIKASLPPTQVARAHRYVGTPDDYLARVPSVPLGEGLPPGETDRPDPAVWGGNGRPDPVAIVLERYNAPGFTSAAAAGGTVVAPGVLVLRGPAARATDPAGPVPAGELGGRTLLWSSLVVVAALFLVGLGWAIGLLPGDPLIRLPLAPAMGAATASLVGLGWAAVGLSFAGWRAALPLAVAAVAGWGVAVWRAVDGRRGGGAPRVRSDAARSGGDAGAVPGG